jgi:prevent-host-death family protein
VVRRVSEKHRPLLLTARGRGVAVVQSLADFEVRQEEQAFMKAVVKGMMDLEAGRELSLADVRKRLELS